MLVNEVELIKTIGKRLKDYWRKKARQRYNLRNMH